MDSGAVPIIKPPGITSQRVVSLFRRLTGVQKAGHTGTLDPAAVGVVVVCFGTATRLVEFTDIYPKRYRAELTFGWSTDTQDSTGSTKAVTPQFELDPARVDEVLEEFVGQIEQVPPMMSALKQSGVRLYKLARQGVSVERQPRTVTVYSLKRFSPTSGRSGQESCDRITFGSRVMLDVECSSGTYVRTLCEDIGARLGVQAHMSYLVRLAASGFTLEDSVALEELADLPAWGEGARLCRSGMRPMSVGGPPFPPEHLVRDLPRIHCRPDEDRLIANGVVPHRLSESVVEQTVESSVEQVSEPAAKRVSKSVVERAGASSASGRVAIYMSSGQLAAVGRVVGRAGRSVIQLEKVVASQSGT
ncbi:MAG: tRNA pseudouridine(55) synthase TruB [Firmicutes bacterium]|nr:tRNA pseudouridine(55) synthase TruB [Bacillota bacterium]